MRDSVVFDSVRIGRGSLARLGAFWRRVGELAALDPRFQPYLDARDGIKGQLEDLALFLRRYADTIEASPARLQQIEERLALLERVKRKYGPTLADVIARRDALRRELSDLEGGDERIAQLERDYAAARIAYLEAAEALGKARRRVAAALSRQLEHLLADLAMGVASSLGVQDLASAPGASQRSANAPCLLHSCWTALGRFHRLSPSHGPR